MEQMARDLGLTVCGAFLEPFVLESEQSVEHCSLISGWIGLVMTRSSDEQMTFPPPACYLLDFPESPMIRPYKGILPQVPATAFVDESAQLIGDVVLGEHASIWMNCVLRGDVNSIRVGNHSNIQDLSVLHGMLGEYKVTVGDWVTVGHSVTLHGCTIEDKCLIGMGSVILNGAVIGTGSIIAAGTVVPERTVVAPNSLWMGVPGKFRKALAKPDLELILRYAKNYLGYKDQYLRERGGH